jgi:hypothetical protein
VEPIKIKQPIMIELALEIDEKDMDNSELIYN